MSRSSNEGKCLVDPDTGRRYPIGGCFKSDKPPNLPKFGSSRSLPDTELPPSVDLRQFLTPVEDQGNTNTCVGNALAGAYEFLIMKNTKKRVNVSRLFIYYNGRVQDKMGENEMKDVGTWINSSIAGLKSCGCCKEELFPYNPTNVNKKPSEQCYQEAAKHRIKDAMSLKVDLNEMKGCLAEGFPFAFGLQTFQSFIEAGKNEGRVPMPKLPYEQENSQHGFHAMLAVGYSDTSKCFIVRNSWGATWGDKGYCYIPYEYMGNSNVCFDLHAIKMVEDDVDRRGRTNVVNTYDWNAHKDKDFYIPPKYYYPDFDYTFFWKLNDNFNYFENIYTNGQVVPFVWKPRESVVRRNDSRASVSSLHEDKRLFILWIDKKSSHITQIEQQLARDRDVKIDFGDTYAQAEEYLIINKNKINKQSPNFLIICRGYYPDVNKNALDLLEFLDRHGLGHIPVIVFTRNKSELMDRLERQASSMRVQNWQERLLITNSAEALVKRLKEKTDNNRGGYY